MAGKLICAFIVALALQMVSSLEEISPETREKLQEAIRDAVETQKESASEISAITREIDIIIGAAVQPTVKALAALGKSIEDAVKKAQAEHVDISDCTEEVRSALANFEKFDKDAVRDCERIPEVKKALTELALIGNEVQVVFNLEESCSASTDQDKCILDGIALTSKKVADLREQIAAELKNAKPEEANVCIGTNAAKMLSDVKRVTENWEQCLQKHKFIVL